jgi:DNA-binding response OmpR family regulator
LRILLVEDEPNAARILAKGLREEAYAVDVVGDGEGALELAQVNDYGVYRPFTEQLVFSLRE